MQKRSGVVGRRHTEVDEIQLRIVRAVLPNRPAAPLIQRQSVPAVSSTFAESRDRVEAPEFLARVDIEPDDESSFWGEARRHTLDYFVADHERPAAQLVSGSSSELVGRRD